MTSDILGVSISGLRVSQNALRTTGHNIANANTPGYSRQATEINSLGGTPSGVGFLGSGAYTNTIDRVVNEFVTTQVRQDTTLYNELNAYNQNILQLNDLLANETTGLTQGLQSFFNAAQTATDDPSSIATRQLLISEAGNLSDRFNTLSARLDSLNEGVNEGISVAVENINNLTANIASLNKSITQFSGSANSTPNDLLDQRDEALRQLSELVSVNISVQDDSQVNITVGNGIPLVLGAESTDIALGQNTFDPTIPEIRLANDAVNQSITAAFSGGEIGGLLNFQQTVIDPTYNEIGRVALAIAESVNELQAQGLTLNNRLGSDLFSDINGEGLSASRVLASTNNTSNTSQLSVGISDASQLTTSDYRVRVDAAGGTFSVTRLSDNTELLTSLVPTTFPSSVNFDGLSLTINAADFNGGEEYLIQPTRTAARNIATNNLQPEDLALASPISTNTEIGNLGTASISAGQVLSLSNGDGDAIGLFDETGEINPPLIVKFTTDTTYDILDNSDPGNPVQLSPPIRNQTYVPGIENALFSRDTGLTTVVSAGASIGLPTGSTQVTQAALKASTTPPSFAGIDFSDSANQFSFDVVISNTPSGSNDGTFTVTINDNPISDTTELLAAINADLNGSPVYAYITDTAQGSALAFALSDHGAGDITLQNYNNDPDLGADTAPVGQANSLLGFDIEGSSFTTVANANGISGIGIDGNNYPSETLTITTTNPQTGITTSQDIVTVANASASSTAHLLDNVDGVSANAYNYAEIRSPSLNLAAPLQFSLNGENLIAYEAGVLSSAVPSPAINSGEDFNDYLAETINANENLQAQGIYAVSAFDADSASFYVELHSTQGDDFAFELTAAASGGGAVSISDGVNSAVNLTGSGTNTTSQLTLGGRIDLQLADNLSLSTNPATSALFGDSSATNFAQSAFLGIEASISGIARAGDSFTLNSNTNAELDNRNAISLINLQLESTIDGDTKTFQQAYNQLVETIGIQANTSQNSTNAASSVLEQTENLRNSISGVNLDEEAADLIRFEQLYSANAQVITVARDLFDTLLNSL